MSQSQLYSKLIEEGATKAVTFLGGIISGSGMFSCGRKEQGDVLAITCFETGKTPEELSRKQNIVNGKMSVKQGWAQAEFKRIGGKTTWKRHGQEPDQDPNNRSCTGLFELNGQSVEITFSVEDAKAAGLYQEKTPWGKQPWKMLRKTIASDAIGMLAPEIYFGDDIEETLAEPRTIKLGGDEVKADPLPEQPESKPVPVETKEETVFEAEVVTEATKSEPATKQEPEQESKPEPKPEPAQTAEELPDDLYKELQQAIGADAKVAMKFLFQKGWLQKGQNLEHLAPGRAKNIIKNRDKFIAKAKEVAA